MFSILSRLCSSKPSKVPYRYRPSVETLEDRWCPATHITLAAAVQAGHTVSLSGAVTGGEVAGVSVMFSGAVNGGTFTDSSGNYSYSTSTASLGTVSAVGSDSFLNTTDTAQASIAVTAPSVTLSIASISQNSVTLTGHLTSLDASGQSVSFSGIVGGSATTNASGDFTLTTMPMSVGNISAAETDPWGQASNTPSVAVSSNVPVIQDFDAVRSIGNTWTFTGRVIDEDPAGLIIHFGGPNSMVGQTVTVNADGTFSFTRTFTDSELPDLVTAYTTDWFNQNSDTISLHVG